MGSERKIGTLSLCALMVGAVLGSGIIILPPLALEASGQWAIVGWLLTSLFGVAFAYVFAHVGTLFPGEGGAASAIERAFGGKAKRLATYTLSGAALFGPAAVMLTIVDYLPPHLMSESGASRGVIAAGVLVACAGLLVSGLRNMSRATLVLASLATALLLAGAGVTLVLHAAPPGPLPAFDGGAMGYTLLLLFWAVVGWEVVGNYGAEVSDPCRTVPRAAISASVIVGLVSMAVAAGLQYGVFPSEAGHGVSALLFPLFGASAPWVMFFLVTALCVTTYLMFVGGVARLVAHLAAEGGLPRVLDRRNARGVPWIVVCLYTFAHLIQIYLSSQQILDVAGILAISDGFFLSNALLGTLAATRLFEARGPRTVAAILSVCVLSVFVQAHWAVLVTVGALGCVACLRVKRRAVV